MTRGDFIALLALDGKRIDDDLVFEDVPGKGPSRVLRTVEVINTGGRKIRLEGHYNERYDSITFCFVCPESGGPICRVDVNGPIHPPAGRTHKHDLVADSDPYRNLPNAIARLDLVGRTPRDVWQILCAQANIQHNGKFIDP